MTYLFYTGKNAIPARLEFSFINNPTYPHPHLPFSPERFDAFEKSIGRVTIKWVRERKCHNYLTLINKEVALIPLGYFAPPYSEPELLAPSNMGNVYCLVP